MGYVCACHVNKQIKSHISQISLIIYLFPNFISVFSLLYIPMVFIPFHKVKKCQQNKIQPPNNLNFTGVFLFFIYPV